MPNKQVRVKIEDIGVKEAEGKPLKQSCSLWMVFLVLFLILVLLIVSLLTAKKYWIGISTKSRPKIENSIIETEGKTRIRVSESEIASLINENNFPLKKPKVSIKPEGIIVSGKNSDNILSLKITATVKPVAKDGKLDYKIVSIKSSGIEAPQIIKDKLNNFKIDSVFGSETIIVESANCYDGFFEIAGTKK